MPSANDRLSYTVKEALAATSLSRNTFYNAIAAKQLQTFTVGRRRMVSVRALQEFIESREKAAQGAA